MLALFLIICLSLDLLGWGIHCVYTRFSCLFLRTLSSILANDCGMNNWMRELDYVKCDSLSQGILFILGLGPYPFLLITKHSFHPPPGLGGEAFLKGKELLLPLYGCLPSFWVLPTHLGARWWWVPHYPDPTQCAADKGIIPQPSKCCLWGSEASMNGKGSGLLWSLLGGRGTQN